MPQYLITAQDQPNALEKRMAAREAHLEGAKNLKANGNFIKAAAFINENNEMCGSSMLLEFNSREDLDNYLANEAYVVQEVWGEIKVDVVKVAPL